MRNLKKILALVLALVMSLSLMATAGATDFKDDGEVSDTYRQAVEVLSELGVFNGDQNGKFNPGQPINRAEVAAILYRIATGDIGLEGNKTYAPYKQFADINAEDWYAGYVTYCGNAGYIKGRSNGEFDAKADVTGYEVLAMILRAVGYDKNNEFTSVNGQNWQLNTASLAREKGVLVNVLEDPNVKLSEAATREVVAELLFRASLLPQVTYNAATLSYVESGETLAKQNLNMERIEGVVIANEWADLRDNDVMAADQTVLATASGERTLAVPTDLTDIGESRYAYVVDTKVLGQLEDTGKNVTKDCVDLDPQGKATKVSSLADELKLTDDTQYFVNFSDFSYDKSDYRIEYSVSFRNENALEWFENHYLNGYEMADLVEEDNKNQGRKVGDVEYLNVSGDYYEDALGNPTTNLTGLTYSRVIPADDTITWLDKAIMQGIFGSAASFDSKYPSFKELSDDIVHAGYVYAGSKSNPNTADTKDDLSDDRTYQQFADEYIGIAAAAYVTGTSNGVWLKIVDNNNDGTAEYVLATVYDLVEVDDYNSREDLYSFSNGGYSDEVHLRDDSYEFGVGDLLLMAEIDGWLVTEEAEIREVTISKYSWKDNSVETTEGDIYYESGADIWNTTGYADQLSGMPYGEPYQIILDHYGFIRAYRPVNNARNYALVTDMYANQYQNTHYIDSIIYRTELMYLDENDEFVKDEYEVANGSGNDLVGIKQYVPTEWKHGYEDTDNLQRAIAHLGVLHPTQGDNTLPIYETYNTTSGLFGGTGTTVLGNEFDYDKQPTNDPNYDSTNYDANDPVDAAKGIDYTHTNIARYTMNEDGTVNLYGAAEYAYNKAGDQLYYWAGLTTDVGTDTNAVVGGTRKTLQAWADGYIAVQKASGTTVTNAAAITFAEDNVVPVYAVDYVMLKNVAINKNTSYRFEIDPSYNDGENLYNKHLNTTSNTLFYLVTPNNVTTYLGYKDLPAIEAKNVEHIYALAQSVTEDKSTTDYWVADIVVIEAKGVDEATNYNWLVYNLFDNYRNGQRAVNHNLDVIDCATGEQIEVNVADNWGYPYGTGFYLLENAKYDDDGNITADSIIAFETVLKPGTGERAPGQWAHTYASYGKWSVMAGEVIRSHEVESKGGYIEVFDEVTDYEEQLMERKVDTYNVPWYSIYALSASAAANGTSRFYASQLSSKDYSGNEPNGHEVIWVSYDGDETFIIDTTFDRLGWTPTYLNDFDYDYYRGEDGLYYQVSTDAEVADAEVTADNVKADTSKVDTVYEIARWQQTWYKAPTTGYETDEIIIRAYLNGEWLKDADFSSAISRNAKGDVWTIDASAINDGHGNTAVRLDVVEDADNVYGKHGTVTRDPGTGDLTIKDVEGTVYVNAILAGSTEKKLTIKAAAGDTATIAASDVVINDSALASNATISTTGVDTKVGSKVYFEFKTDADKTIGLYSVKLDANPAVTYSAEKVASKSTNTTTVWGVTYYMTDNATVIEVSGDTATYHNIKAEGDFKVNGTGIIANNADIPTLTIQSTGDATGKEYVVTKITVGTTELTPKDTPTAANEYSVNADTGVITFGTGTKATGDIVITAALKTKTFTVTVEMLDYATVDGKDSWSAEVPYNGSTSVTLVPEEGYTALTASVSGSADAKCGLVGNVLSITEVKEDATIVLSATSQADVLASLKTAADNALKTITLNDFEGDATAQKVLDDVRVQINSQEDVKAFRAAGGIVTVAVKTSFPDVSDGAKHDDVTYTVTLKLSDTDGSPATEDVTIDVTDSDYKALDEAADAIAAIADAECEEDGDNAANVLAAAKDAVEAELEGTGITASGYSNTDPNAGDNDHSVSLTLTLNGKTMSATVTVNCEDTHS